MPFYDFDFIQIPNNPEGHPVPDVEKNLLVLCRAGEERIKFLYAVLQAAGYTSPSEQVHLLPLEAENSAVDLAALVRFLGVDRVMIFGLNGPALGLHLQVGAYIPVAVNATWYMLADDLAVIQSEKAAGKAAKAGALWKAVKLHFLREA